MATAQKKISIKEKIKSKVSEKPSDWLQGAEQRSARRGALHHARRVSLLVLRELEKQQMSQAALADKMGVSRQQVTKIVKGQENFTFETIAKLEDALGVPIMTVDLRRPGHLQATPVAFATSNAHSAPEAALMPAGPSNPFAHVQLPIPPIDPLGYFTGSHKNYVPDVELSAIPVNMLQGAGLIRDIPAPLSPTGLTPVYRINHLTPSNWQARMGEVFDKLKQQHGPFTNFVIVVSAVPSASNPPDLIQAPYAASSKVPSP